ncbi:FKBP-type peptidyl-prolyl cis-trans isomerase [Brachybacterium hainanense]|uniref:Peptidyl-prolyl cis-trans isomerase n=1 Tax=Brachybacterium hainanense TaxID=1541174 RepID=A0ABV6RBB7_9MICO
MIRRRTLLGSALAATAAIGLAACSDDATTGGASDGGGDALDAVTVSDDLGSAPVVEFAAPLSIESPSSKVVVPGDGAAIAEGDTIVWRSLFVAGASGETLQSWWEGGPAGGLTLSTDTAGAEAVSFLTTATVGSRVAMSGWQKDGSGAMVSLVQVADIDQVVSPLRAEGAAAAPSGTYPAVTLGEDGAPAISGPGEGEPPAATIVEPLITGTGEKTAAGDYLVMQYTGWSWDDGEKFDSSWDRGAPFGFVQGQSQVIQGWDENLVGLPVGSQVMLVIPPAEAYGDDPAQHELGGKTLVFVVDVLARGPRQA